MTLTSEQIEKLKELAGSFRRVLEKQLQNPNAMQDNVGACYVPTTLYIKAGDYESGLDYVEWFGENFPDDDSPPSFLFEWAFLLFKAGKMEAAERKVLATFFANPYFLDHFLGLPLESTPMQQRSNRDGKDYLNEVGYSKKRIDMAEFSFWLSGFCAGDAFRAIREPYVQAKHRLLSCTDEAERQEIRDLLAEMEMQAAD